MILTLNAGSSSVKFSAYEAGATPARVIDGQIDAIGSNARLVIGDAPPRALGATGHADALDVILRALAPHLKGHRVAGVGHRIVHGGPTFGAPVALDPDVITQLEAFVPLAPLHQPHNLAMVSAAQQKFPDAVQIGCFDTAFHKGHPWVNDTFALPRRFYDEGVRRYGFHGLSYDYITTRMRHDWPDLSAGRVVIAHLGNGASMCAVRDGHSVGSTMGFSALDGLPMGTRCGQLDPGVLIYFMDRGMTAPEITDLLYTESGLKGLSGISHDMRTLLASDAPEAAEAVDYYVFRIRRELGAMTAVLGGIDALVFCGGIGEHAAEVRARVVAGMSYLGLTLDADANLRNATSIHAGDVPILVIPTNEELVIAQAVATRLSA